MFIVCFIISVGIIVVSQFPLTKLYSLYMCVSVTIIQSMQVTVGGRKLLGSEGYRDTIEGIVKSEACEYVRRTLM